MTPLEQSVALLLQPKYTAPLSDSKHSSERMSTVFGVCNWLNRIPEGWCLSRRFLADSWWGGVTSWCLVEAAGRWEHIHSCSCRRTKSWLALSGRTEKSIWMEHMRNEAGCSMPKRRVCRRVYVCVYVWVCISSLSTGEKYFMDVYYALWRNNHVT